MSDFRKNEKINEAFDLIKENREILMVVDHIGYLVKDINKSIEVFKSLGFRKETKIYRDDEPEDGNSARNVDLCFMRNETTRVELVSPIDENSDVFSTIKRLGEGPYHICYKVSNLDSAISNMEEQGWLVLKKPAKAIAFHYARVAFLFRHGGGLIELVEMKENDSEK